jgi:hypothetical protein
MYVYVYVYVYVCMYVYAPHNQQSRPPARWYLPSFIPSPQPTPKHRQKPQSNEARIGLLAFRTVNSTMPVTLAYACGGKEAGRMPTKCFQVRKQCWVVF